MKWNVGIGSTNRCNLNCPHCYSRENNRCDLKYKDFEKILDNLEIDSINFGTGENLLNPEFLKILDLIKDRGIKTSLTSNGYTVLNMPDTYLHYFNDIDISLEFPNKSQQDNFRGQGAWDLAISAIEKCKSPNIETSIACCMMSNNVDEIANFDGLVNEYDINFRINTYKPVSTKDYCLSYEKFWYGVKSLFSRMKLISCSEPVVCAVLGLETSRATCGCGKRSIRITPSGAVLPCVYWNKSNLDINKLDLLKPSTFDGMCNIPAECQKCKYVDSCQGGCEARRLYNDLTKPDEYCPFIRGEKISIAYEKSKDKDLVHSSYLCTMIFGK
ncbi:MAG: radical SAM protein [Oscillospiraceae bacterium]|jgi:radical SAM protein with 4Fe4S-binding SPASM domain|nr:radical SAM protein [Oscillospiraceae bacterium]